MAYASALSGGYGSGPSVIPIDPSHPGAVSIPDAELLFTGDFQRAGPDLVLVGHDGRHLIIPGYFDAEQHAALVAPNGASLSADLIELLAGPRAAGQYAQAHPTLPANAIGRVEKVVGNVTVMRNGVAVALHVGDAVYKSDVIQTGADSSAGISFPDGTALNLVANTRMALNDYVYDPNGTANDALFSLVQGGFAFVAGKVAHTGDMKINTPVATMGIRGTAGYALQDIATVTANLGNVTMSFALVANPDDGHVGRYELIDQFGEVVAVVGDRGIWTTLSWRSANQSPSVTTHQMTAAENGIEQALVPALVQILNAINNANPNTPTSTPNNGQGSSSPPFNPNAIPQLLQQNSGTPFAINVPVNGPNGPTNTSGTVTITSTTPSPPATTTVLWTGQNGSWENAANWGGAALPAAADMVEIDTAVKVTIGVAETIAGVIIGPNAILNIGNGGSLAVSHELANSGVLEINSTGSDPTLAIDGTVFVSGGGTIELKGPTADNLIVGVSGTDAWLVNLDNAIVGSGMIGQGDGALTLVNAKGGVVEAARIAAGDSGVLIVDTGNDVDNSGVLAADGGGTLELKDGISNSGRITAFAGGLVSESGGIDNYSRILATGSGADVDLKGNVTNERHGTIEAKSGGTITVEDAIANAGLIAVGAGSEIALDNAAINGGTVIARAGGVIAAQSGTGVLDPRVLTNNGTLEAANGATLDVGTAVGGVGSATIGAGSTVKFESGVAGTQTVTFGGAVGTLALADAADFHATVGGLVVGDTIDLTNISVSSAIIEGSTLVVQETGGGSLSFNLTGSLAGEKFDLTPDQHGGTDLVLVTASNTWTNAEGDGQWTTPGNWSEGSLPAAGEPAIINSDGNPAITVNLTLDGMSIQNAGEIDVCLASGETLTLDDGTTITGGGTGELVIDCGSTVTVAAGSGDVTGATFDGLIVNDYGSLDVGQCGDDNATLTIADGTTISGCGDLTIDGKATLDVEGGEQPASTLDGVTVTDYGAIAIGATSTAELIVNGDTTIYGEGYGSLTIYANSTLSIQQDGWCSNPTLDNLAVTDSGAIDIGGICSGATLTLDDGTSIVGGGTGSLTINACSTLDIETGNPCADGLGATLDGVNVTDHGTIEVGYASSGAVLTLDDGTMIDGDGVGALKIYNGGTLDIEPDGPGYDPTLNSVSVTNDGTIEVGVHDSGAVLTLEGGASISGCGNIDNEGTVVASGMVDIGNTVSGAGSFTIDHGATLQFDKCVGYCQTVTFADSSGTLALSDPSDFHGSIAGLSAGDTIDLTNICPAEIESATIVSGSTLVVDVSGYDSPLTFNVAGSLSGNIFTVQSDGAGGTDLTLAPGFTAFSDGQSNHSQYVGCDGDYHFSSSDYSGPVITGSTLQLTDGHTAEYGSWFSGTTQSISSFTASFDYQASGSAPLADGFAFVLQDSPFGNQALANNNYSDSDYGFASLGYGGAGLGYEGISNSAAVEFNLYSGHTQGTNFATNGTVGVYNPTGDVYFYLGDSIHVTLSYNGTVLTETLTDLTNPATFTANYQISLSDLSSILGSDSAYVGFTGATGLNMSTQTISDFSFVSVAPVAYWAGASGDDWSNPNAWTDSNGGIVDLPNANNDVIIGESGSYTLTITSAEAAKTLTITSAGAGADVQDEAGGSLTVAGALNIDAGSFSLNGGTLSADSIYVGSSGHFNGEGTVSAPLDNNGGTVEALGDLSLQGAVTGYGTYQIENGETLQFGSSVASGATVTFAGGTGTLDLAQPAAFNGEIAGFTGTAPDAGHSDVIDLAGIDYNSVQFSESYNSASGVLTVSDGTNSASLTFIEFTGSFKFASDGSGGTDIFDPPAQNSASQSVAIGGAANDSFFFHSRMGAETATHFSPPADTIEPDRLANIESTQQVAALVTTDAHGDPAIELGHGDSILLPSVSMMSHLQAHLHSLAHLS